MKINNTVKNALARIGVVFAVVVVIVIICYSKYADEMAAKIELKSRYTFTVCIDTEGNLVSNKEDAPVSSEQGEEFAGLAINQIGDIWIREYLAQYTQKYLSVTKSLRKVQTEDTTVLDAENNTVLISFSAMLADSTTEYFSSWQGILDEGRLKCEWVVRFDIDNHYDGTATIYVDSMLTPEDYGIYQYNESIKNENAGNEELIENNSNSLTSYIIRDSSLYVSYDGGESYTAVPVAFENLFTKVDDTSTLREGCYMISTTKTAILYGGKSDGGENIPVTLVYTNNKGDEWITCEIDQIYTADYMYVEFFGEKLGVIVVGYDKSDMYESSRIYSTKDGGLTWDVVGTGPSTDILKGVKFIDENNGFFCYEYTDGMDSNMYLTKDGGKTFSKLVFEAQKLEGVSVDSQLQWSDVFKEAQIPRYDDNGVLTVYITQGNDAVFNGGNTVARYQSSDKGGTWKYIGQFEINSLN